MGDSSAMRNPAAQPGAGASLIDLVDAPQEPAVRRELPRTAAAPDVFGKLALLPKGSDEYKAHGIPSKERETTLFCVDRLGYYEAFAWSAYDGMRLERSEAPGGGPVLVVRFSGMDAIDVRIEGWRLELLAVLLAQHRMIWIRELPAGEEAPNSNEPVIARISYAPAATLADRLKGKKNAAV